MRSFDLIEAGITFVGLAFVSTLSYFFMVDSLVIFMPFIGIYIMYLSFFIDNIDGVYERARAKPKNRSDFLSAHHKNKKGRGYRLEGVSR